jgi:hypothetical protein
MTFSIEHVLEADRIYKLQTVSTDSEGNKVIEHYVMKMEDDEFKDNIEHEYKIGCQLNKLCLPNFVDTVDLVVGNRGLRYCTSDNCIVEPCQFSHIDCDRQFLITSFVQGVSLHEVKDITIVKSCLIQLLLLLDYMSKEYGFTHYDLHWANIIVIDLKEKHKVVYPTYTIHTQYIPVIIDYGRAYTTQVGGFCSPSNTFSTHVKAETNFKHDLIYLLYSCELDDSQLLFQLRNLYGLPSFDDSNDNSNNKLNKSNKKNELSEEVKLDDGEDSYDSLFEISCDVRTQVLDLDPKIGYVTIEQLKELCPELFTVDTDNCYPVYHKSQCCHPPCFEHKITQQISDVEMPEKYLFKCRNIKYHRDTLQYILDVFTLKDKQETNVNISEDMIKHQLEQLNATAERILQQQQSIMEQNRHFKCNEYCQCNDNKVIPETAIHLLTGVNYQEHKDIDWIIDILTKIKDYVNSHQTEQLIELFNAYADKNEYGCETTKSSQHDDINTSLFINLFYIYAANEINLYTTSSIFGNNSLTYTIKSYYGLTRFGNEYY